MFLENMKSDQVTQVIDNLLENSKDKELKKNSKDFSNWFELSKDNIKLNFDSLLIMDRNIIDSYVDTGNTIVGTPLGALLSFENIEDQNSNLARLNIKIPHKLEMNFTNRLDDTKKYCIFFIESKSNLFKSNISEQNVDNSYIAIKELLDSKFNMTRELDYKDIPFVLSEICSNNSIKGFQLLIYELLTMGLSRNVNDASKEFRYEATDKSKYNDFQMINVRDISRNASAFSALASENISKSILTALRQSKNESRYDIITPQEQIALRKF